MDLVTAILIVLAVVAVLLSVFIIIGKIKERPEPASENEAKETIQETAPETDEPSEPENRDTEPPAEEKPKASEQRERICRVCGERLKENEKFCPVCGER